MSLHTELAEAYNHLLYAIANAPENTYPKFTKNNVKKYPEDKAAHIIENVISHRLSTPPPPQDGKPRVELVMGYPGVGKTLVENELLAKYSGELLKVDYDDYRSYDSRVLETSRQNPLVADYFGQIPGGIKDGLLARAAQEGKSILLSAPALDIQASDTNSLRAMFLESGYHISVTYTAANESLCYLSNFTRHFKARMTNFNNGGRVTEIPRMVKPEVHRVISAGTRHNIHEIIDMIDRGANMSLRVVDRNNKEFAKGDIHNIPTLARQNERRPLTPPEIERLINELNIISTAALTVGLNYQERNILSKYAKTTLYKDQILRNTPKIIPLFTNFKDR